jgi:uncharacterized protein YecE (DUF72 family)
LPAGRPRPCKSLIRIGTAGWDHPRGYPKPADRSRLAHYATHFNCVEINSSFYRTHQRSTYERWATSTGQDFSFCVKIPQVISHDAALRGCRDELRLFCDGVKGLGKKLGVLLLQLPPKAEWDARVARRFFGLLRSCTAVPVVCEPRHPSWSGAGAERQFKQFGISLVCADPVRLPRSWSLPGEIRYYRLHGSPRMYWSSYRPDQLDALAGRIAADRARFPQIWCIFDNTAAGAAWDNATDLAERLRRAGA